jgi:hypothetical protein
MRHVFAVAGLKQSRPAVRGAPDPQAEPSRRSRRSQAPAQEDSVAVAFNLARGLAEPLHGLAESLFASSSPSDDSRRRAGLFRDHHSDSIEGEDRGIAGLLVRAEALCHLRGSGNAASNSGGGGGGGEANQPPLAGYDGVLDDQVRALRREWQRLTRSPEDPGVSGGLGLSSTEAAEICRVEAYAAALERLRVVVTKSLLPPLLRLVFTQSL